MFRRSCPIQKPTGRVCYGTQMNNHDDRECASPPVGAENAELMYIKCAACGAWLDVKPGEMNRVSHSLCSECYVKALASLADDRAARATPHRAGPTSSPVNHGR